MRVKTHLRQLRGNRSIRDLETATGINRGVLSKIEHGRQLPTDEQIGPLERAYGPLGAWYDWRGPWVAVDPDEDGRG